MRKLSEDSIAGYVERATKSDGSDAKMFLVHLYELDQFGRPVVVGKWTDKQGRERDSYRVYATLRLPESTFIKMASGKSKRCLLFNKL